MKRKLDVFLIMFTVQFVVLVIFVSIGHILNGDDLTIGFLAGCVGLGASIYFAYKYEERQDKKAERNRVIAELNRKYGHASTLNQYEIRYALMFEKQLHRERVKLRNEPTIDRYDWRYSDILGLYMNKILVGRCYL